MQHHTIDSPREKLVRYGIHKLTDIELVRLIIATGTKKVSSEDIAKKILTILYAADPDDVPFDEIVALEGMGIAKTTKIVGALALARRIVSQGQEMMTPHDVWQSVREIHNERKEHFVSFYLDARNHLLKKETVAVGTVDSSFIHPREVFEPAIRLIASSIILIHNHPSGETTPSDADIVTTKRLVRAGQILGVPIADHVIVSATGFCSMRSKGLLGV